MVAIRWIGKHGVAIRVFQSKITCLSRRVAARRYNGWDVYGRIHERCSQCGYPFLIPPLAACVLGLV